MTDGATNTAANQEREPSQRWGPARATSVMGTQPVEENVPRGDGESAPRLLGRLLDDVTTLIRKEMALATSEISHAVDEARKGATGLVSGGAVLYAGGLFLLLAATFALALIMPAWAAALIVGAAVSLVGLVMVQSGKRKVEARSFAPERTAQSMRKDRDMIERQRHPS
jgi:hypothetical protein